MSFCRAITHQATPSKSSEVTRDHYPVDRFECHAAAFREKSRPRKRDCLSTQIRYSAEEFRASLTSSPSDSQLLPQRGRRAVHRQPFPAVGGEFSFARAHSARPVIIGRVARSWRSLQAARAARRYWPMDGRFARIGS